MRGHLNELRGHMVRAEGDFGPDKINGKILRAEVAKVHTMLVVGSRDIEGKRERAGAWQGQSRRPTAR